MKNIISILFLMLSFMSLAQSQSITVTYHYDDLHRLDRATYSNGIIINYTYDALGNRTSYVVTGACALATPSVSKQDATCGTANGSLTVTATGNGLQYSKDGTTFQTSNIFSNLAAGSYIISIRDVNNCIATSQSVVIQTTTILIPTIQVSGNILASSSSTGNQWFLNGQAIIGATNQFYTATQLGRSVQKNKKVVCWFASLMRHLLSASLRLAEISLPKQVYSNSYMPIFL